MSVNRPDSRKPWCPICEAHTDYHLDPKHSSTHTCNECGSSIWKPTAPVPITIVVVGLICFLNWLAFSVLSEKISADTELVENWFVTVAIWVVSIFLLRVVWNNWEHWRKFHRWKKK